MDLKELVVPASVACITGVASKKRALEKLAELLTGEGDDERALQTYQHLTEREKLGSTSLGHGVALPHARLAGCKAARGAFIKLDRGIDFESPDGQPTDMLFALLVPEHENDEHLRILASLASLFNDTDMCERLRDSGDDTELYNRLTGWHIASEAS